MSTLLSVSMIGGTMIMVIAGLRALLQNRLHRTVFLLLWLLVALRLVIPVMMPSRVSVYNLLPQSSPDYVEYHMDVQEEQASKDPSGLADTDGFAVEQGTLPDRDVILKWGWLTGGVMCFLYFLWVHIRARLRYRFALPEEGPAFLGNIRLKRSDQISSPLVYGFFRPVILLPYDFPEKDSPEYEQVLQHELTHVRSGDLWFKLGLLLVTCIHWFNPLVWLMLYLSSQDLEFRCDERVIRKLGKKKAYAIALLKAETQHTEHFSEAAFAFSMTERRLRAITGTRVYLPRSILLCTVLTVALLCCFATGPVTAESVVIAMEDSEICDSALLLQCLTEKDPVSDASGDGQGAYMMSYSNSAEQSLKDGGTAVAVPTVLKREASGTTVPEADTDRYQNTYAGSSETVIEPSDHGQSSPKGQPVRGSNGKQYNVNVEEFTQAFSGKDVWATNPGETFDPFHP